MSTDVNTMPRRERVEAALRWRCGDEVKGRRARAGGAWAWSWLSVGAFLAGPLVIGLIGERITGFKAFAVEVSLAEVEVPVEGDFSGTVMDIAEMGPSASPDLSRTFDEAIRSRTKIMRVNLRDDDYWWSTRVYLVAALAEDYTDVEALVFVRAGDQRLFVGIAEPPAVRR